MRISLLVASLVASAAFLLTPTQAHAGIDACGGIYLEAGAECEVIPPSAACTTQCTPLSVQATCAADLQAQCSTECTGSASLECSGSCETNCQAECEVNPGSFDCATYCTADCAGGCDAQCSDSQCVATCEANCSATCDTECNVVPASADCTASCEGSCSGSCTAESTLSCQSACTSSLYVDCTTDVQGGCVTACDSTDGALFCDGHYVDVEGDLAACVSALKDLLNIEVSGYADASCEGNTCKAEAGVGCSIGAGQRGAVSFAGLFLLGMVLAFGRRRDQKD
jgi:MYXO-CTERM domain-containing protein